MQFRMTDLLSSPADKKMYAGLYDGCSSQCGVFGNQLDAVCAASEAIPKAPNAFHTFEKLEGSGEVVHSRTEGFLCEYRFTHTPVDFRPCL